MKTKRILLSVFAVLLFVVMLGGAIAVGYDAFVNELGNRVVIDKDNNLPVVKPSKGSANVETENGMTTSEVTLEATGVTAIIPEGTKLDDGVNKVTLSVKPIENSNANITLDANEEKVSYDVHIEGVSKDNTAPIEIYVKEMLPKGLNMGNYKLYHVENGETVEMTLLADGEAPVHNSFDYDTVTGDVNLYLASFSEVAVVADTENAWNGTYDYEFVGDGTQENPYIISSADELAGFGAIVGGMNGQARNSYERNFVKLIADINLGYGVENHTYRMFHPIGYYFNENYTFEDGTPGVYSTVYSFEGTFDGNGHTIANFYHNTWEIKGDYNSGYPAGSNHYKDAMGLFGYVKGGTVQNLTVDNFSSDGEFTPTGVIAAFADGESTFKNIAITNCNPRVYNTGNGGIIGIAGDTTAANDDHIKLENITIDNTNKISALWGSWDVACGGLVGMYRGNVDANGDATGDTINFTNCHVAAQIDVYNDVCANYQYYAYRYAGMIIGSVRHNTVENGKTVPNMAGISASGCTVHYDTWNDYFYCELKVNTIASYTHDYQFSRLTEVKSIEGTTITYLDGTKGTVPSTGKYNYVVVSGEFATENAECYHFVDGKQWTHDQAGKETINGVEIDVEDHAHIYLPFAQLFTGYSWGVSSKGLTDFEGVEAMDITYRESTDLVDKFEKNEALDGDFLYRVGNGNAFPIGKLFQEISENIAVDSGVYVSVESLVDGVNLVGTFVANNDDWTLSTLHITGGTGPAKLTIQDYNNCKPFELIVEVVDATNVTSASFSGNTVLLQDVSTSSTLGASGVVYGNGFTVNMENAPISEKNGAIFHLYDGAVLKNLSIVGREFTSVAMNVNDTDYGVSVVRAWGTVTIENCYISGCRSAVSVTGTELTIKDSVIANGVYANVDFRSGILNLHNVTTINEPHSVNGTTIVGLGIVGNMTASAGRQLNITGTLTQYNWVSKSDCANIKANGVSDIFDSVFTDDKYASLRYNYGGTTYVNTGILSLCSDFVAGAVTGAPSDYSGMAVTATIYGVSVDGYVWAPSQAGTLTTDNMQYHDKAYAWTSKDQGSSYIAPAFDYTNAGLTAENGVVQIEYESGSSYTLSADTIKKLFTATKYGKDLSYTISMNGTDYTGRDIVFNEKASKSYTITFTITDNLVYDKDGKLTNTTYEITKELKVLATVVDKTADAPTFTFYYGTNGSASAGTPHTTQPTNSYTSTIKLVGETYYIMPNVSASSTNAIGAQTVDNETIYYPIVDGINVRSGNSSDYDFMRYYPIFKAVKISDNGTEYTYAGTKEMPATVSWVSATIDSGNGASALNDGFGLYNNQYLCKIQKKAGDAEGGGTSVVKFSYTALDGNTYYYYVGFRFYDEDEGGICVTPDTLVTMADGTQKRIDEVTYDDMILVWDFFNGEYTAVPSMIIMNHGYDNYTVVALTFDDGTVVKTINGHGFYEADENKFVILSDNNASDYIGHSFVKADGTTTKLVSYTVTEEYTESWSILSVYHYNCILEGMLTLTPAEVEGSPDYLMPFEVNDDMKYDEEKMQADIEKYGLYTYEDLAEYMSYDVFVATNSAIAKVSIGKGYITLEDHLKLLGIHFA